jgi:hypothetical protein
MRDLLEQALVAAVDNVSNAANCPDTERERRIGILHSVLIDEPRILGSEKLVFDVTPGEHQRRGNECRDNPSSAISLTEHLCRPRKG